MSEMFTTDIEDGQRKSALIPLTEPPPEMVADWNQIGLFTTGVALGAVLGATIALLVAPASGRDTRGRVARKFGHGSAGESVWDELADELAQAERELRKAGEESAPA
ncbi:MAG: YtxH domain-containing protein [Gemmatimonadaceae bacterium]|nr:YtxH domain-containing protein [Gemmatimonadaceae bacterium]